MGNNSQNADFTSDSVKINVEQIFKMLSPSTDIKTLWRCKLDCHGWI